MRVIFSRKGFDSTYGKASSPILEDEPVSLPIPTKRRSETTYRDIGLGDIVERVTNARISADDLCHEDPMFWKGRWAFGQTGISQAHLERTGVGVGDVFLFFGLFASSQGRDRHHRIFGYMEVDEVRRLGSQPSKSDHPDGFPRRHPHTIGEWNKNNTLYLGRGARARVARPCLRLTKVGAQISEWSVPPWLKMTGLSYHKDRWLSDTELRCASPGQEFVTDISDDLTPRQWLLNVQAAIEGDENLKVPLAS